MSSSCFIRESLGKIPMQWGWGPQGGLQGEYQEWENSWGTVDSKGGGEG